MSGIRQSEHRLGYPLIDPIAFELSHGLDVLKLLFMCIGILAPKRLLISISASAMVLEIGYVRSFRNQYLGTHVADSVCVLALTDSLPKQAFELLIYH